MSNQFRLEQERDLICLIDTGRVMTAPLGDRTQLDTALDATIAVGLVADQVGDRCGAVAFDTEIGKFIKPLRYGGEYLIKALYDIEPRSLESDYTAAFQLVESLKRSLVIVFTDLFEPSAARPLIAALPVLAAKHAVVVASATDPELELDLHRQPRELIDAYRQAATLDVVEVREKVIKAARQAGALVVTASPKNLGAACIDAYLREKRRARI